ncbi:hypothetical protein EII17_01795 [Clostridiales bacterium COT073_COT-073]|nr:hypothetical protein EII17_01795 [Clostridiales bacterium COT073_COT-073]
MKKIMLLCMALILLLSLFSCSKDEILDNYNSVLQTAGDIQLIGNASLVGKREYGIDHYTGSYKADYNKFSGEEILFGGTSIEREAGKKITLSCDLEIKEGVAQLLLISGSDKPQILHEVSGTYEEIITLPDGSNYIQIYGQDFTGNIILNIE